MSARFMPVKVVIFRRFSVDMEAELRPIVQELHKLALNQKGYVGGEKLRGVDEPEVHLVISHWETMEDWNVWLHSEKRATIQEKIDQITGSETLYQLYYHCTSEFATPNK